MNYQKDFEFLVDFKLEVNGYDSDNCFYEITNNTPYSLVADCPNCNTYARFDIKTFEEVTEKNSQTIKYAIVCFCPKSNCTDKTIFFKAQVDRPEIPTLLTDDPLSLRMKGLITDVYPPYKVVGIENIEDIEEFIREDYLLAYKSFQIHPKLSIVMSRLVVERFIKAKLTNAKSEWNLKKLIEKFIELEESNRPIPPNLKDDLTHIRFEGNDIVHCNDRVVTDQLEAAIFNLDLLDDLFDFYYVRPARRQRKYHPNVSTGR